MVQKSLLIKSNYNLVLMYNSSCVESSVKHDLQNLRSYNAAIKGVVFKSNQPFIDSSQMQRSNNQFVVKAFSDLLLQLLNDFLLLYL